MQKVLPWVLVIYVAFVFLQSLVFKFSGSEETVIIFDTIGDWMAGIGPLSALAEPFRNHGGVAVGVTELIASTLILIPRTRLWGALLALGVISGAIFFHLFTPLGVVRQVDAAGNTDGGVLFYMACGVWIASAITVYLNRPR
ncbi:MAG: hypothetical protein AAGI15_03450 [Pseudomonadota bacterium]